MHASPPFYTSFAAAKQAYRDAWADPAHTRFELPPVNVNKVLRDRYRTGGEGAMPPAYGN